MRLLRAAGIVALFATGSALLATDAAAAQPAPAPARPAAVHSAVRTDVNAFEFASFDADYYLGTDSDGRSTLKTVETLVAQFPASDQNHGIQRAIPLDYDGHPVDVSLDSVTDENGTPRSFSTDTSDDGGDFLLVTIAADDFVHGSQSYVLTYTQHNVTKHFADTNDDEFYWDTNGTAWAQPFGTATARVHVPQTLAGSLTGDAACYAGPSGSTDSCPIADAPGEGGETVFTANAAQLAAGENLTVSIGFAPGTFVPREDSFFVGWQGFGQLAAGILAAIAAGVAAIYRFTVLRDAPGRPTIVAEYAPPPAANIFTAAVVMKRTNRAIAAAFVDFAVRGSLQIVERESESRWSSAPVYWLRRLTGERLDSQERSFMRLIFGDGNEWRELKKNDQALAKGVVTFLQDARKQAYAEGYLRGGTKGAGILLAVIGVALALGSLVFGFILLQAALGGTLPLVIMGVGLAAAVGIFFLVLRTPLTAKGSELRDYLLGVEEFIKVAEQDRYRMLQSPEGALKTRVADAPPTSAAGGAPIDQVPTDQAPIDQGQVVKIYEKLLPYAVLFGLEKDWAKVLGTYYEDLGTQPDWYYGSSGFNAGFFAASVGSFSSTAASSYSGSASSSSSGGSGGGGSSGGGGGGGGGGGV